MNGSPPPPAKRLSAPNAVAGAAVGVDALEEEGPPPVAPVAGIHSQDDIAERRKPSTSVRSADKSRTYVEK